jgi:homoserine dehydrogenase
MFCPRKRHLARIQRPAEPDAAEPGAKTVILITHETTEAAARRALDGITKDELLLEWAQMIRIERAGEGTSRS